MDAYVLAAYGLTALALVGYAASLLRRHDHAVRQLEALAPRSDDAEDEELEASDTTDEVTP